MDFPLCCYKFFAFFEMDSSKPNITVGASSFLNLKAELSKKEALYQKEKAKVGNHTVQASKFQSKLLRKPESRIVGKHYDKSNRGVAEREDTDFRVEHDSNVFEASRIALEQKTRRYNELQARGDDTNNEDILVDFLMKQQDEDEEKDTKVPKLGKLWKGKKHTQLIEIVDEFGRSRMVKENSQMAKDYLESKERQELDEIRNAQDTDSDTNEPPAISAPESPKERSSVHFDASRERTRMMGVGFYQFSSSDDKRQEQMQELKQLRTDTVNFRQHSDIVKQKRLQKIEERKSLLAERAIKRKRDAEVSNFLENL